MNTFIDTISRYQPNIEGLSCPNKQNWATGIFCDCDGNVRACTFNLSQLVQRFHRAQLCNTNTKTNTNTNTNTHSNTNTNASACSFNMSQLVQRFHKAQLCNTNTNPKTNTNTNTNAITNASACSFNLSQLVQRLHKAQLCSVLYCLLYYAVMNATQCNEEIITLQCTAWYPT